MSSLIMKFLSRFLSLPVIIFFLVSLLLDNPKIHPVSLTLRAASDTASEEVEGDRLKQCYIKKYLHTLFESLVGAVILILSLQPSLPYLRSTLSLNTSHSALHDFICCDAKRVKRTLSPISLQKGRSGE